MDFKIVKPSGILSKYIKHYWMIETSANEGLVKERIIPTGSIDLIFHYANGLTVHKPNGENYQQAPILLSGQSSSFVDVVSNGKIGMISTVFYPQAASLFFDFPLNIIENQAVYLPHLLKNDLSEVNSRLNLSNSFEERIKIIEGFLLDQLKRNANKQTKLINWALKIIDQSKGQVSSSQVADKLGISKRQLERKFATQIGKSPKKFIKIVRFQSVLASASKMTEEKLSNLAYDNGYFDQAHFINDFRAHTGYSPKEFFQLYDVCSDYYG